MRAQEAKPTQAALEEMEQRVLALLLPRIPRTEEERATVCLVAQEQWRYEQRAAAAFDGQEVPADVKSFRLGDFSMEMAQGRGGPLTRRTMCPSAYARLLNAGLLYRGLGAC